MTFEIEHDLCYMTYDYDKGSLLLIHELLLRDLTAKVSVAVFERSTEGHIVNLQKI